MVIMNPAIIDHGSGSGSRDGRLKMARNRMLIYMDALDMDPVEAAEMTRQVLENTRGRMAADPRVEPVSLAMQSLRQILAGKNRIDPVGRMVRITEMVFLPPTPPLNIGHMVPQKLERKLFSRTAASVRLRWILFYTGFLLLLAAIYSLI